MSDRLHCMVGTPLALSLLLAKRASGQLVGSVIADDLEAALVLEPLRCNGWNCENVRHGADKLH